MIGTTLIALILFIIFEVRRHKKEQKDDEKSKVPVDYNYF